MLEARRGSDDDDGLGGRTERDAGNVKDRPVRIRCPLCRWQPERHHRWYCHCGYCWNTFETRGVCPACHYAWQETQCHRCNRMSAHVDWYEGSQKN